MPSTQFGEVTKAWTFGSDSSPTKKYQTLLHENGTVSCDCMGWTRRVAADGTRSCKHTRAVDMGVADSQAEATKDYKGTTKSKAPKTAAAIKTEAPTEEGVVRRIRW